MCEAFVSDDRQLFFNPALNGLGDGSISVVRTGIGLLFERQEGVIIGQLPKRWENPANK